MRLPDVQYHGDELLYRRGEREEPPLPTARLWSQTQQEIEAIRETVAKAAAAPRELVYGEDGEVSGCVVHCDNPDGDPLLAALTAPVRVIRENGRIVGSEAA